MIISNVWRCMRFPTLSVGPYAWLDWQHHRLLSLYGTSTVVVDGGEESPRDLGCVRCILIGG